MPLRDRGMMSESCLHTCVVKKAKTTKEMPREISESPKVEEKLNRAPKALLKSPLIPKLLKKISKSVHRSEEQ